MCNVEGLAFEKYVGVSRSWIADENCLAAFQGVITLMSRPCSRGRQACRASAYGEATGSTDGK